MTSPCAKSKPSDRSTAIGASFLLATSVIWGTTGATQELANVNASPALVGAARLEVGAIALLALALAAGRHQALLLVLKPPLLPWTLAAGIATAVFQAAFFSAVQETGVAIAAVVTLGSAPVFCGLLAQRFLGEHLSGAWRIATGCAVTGCAVLLLPGSVNAPSISGVALALVAGACYGAYTITAKRLLDAESDAIAVLAATIGVGAVLSAPVFAAGVGTLATPAGIAVAGWLGLVATAGAYMLFARGLARVPAATAGTLSLAEPLTAAFLGIVVLAERPSALAIGGSSLIVAGLATTVWATQADAVMK